MMYKKHYTENQDWATPIPLKPEVKSCSSEMSAVSVH
jgi:hypothetical protein